VEMPRVPTEEVARQLAERMSNRGHQGSIEWLSAWCRRWGSKVAKDTSSNPLFLHERDGDDVLIGTDRIHVDLYREWKDLQDGSRTIRGTPDGTVYWEG